jgi:hypothetical protein
VDDALDRLAARYAFRRPEEVLAYLCQYPNLIPILLEAAVVIPRYFGPDAPLILEVVIDPESEIEARELLAIARVSLTPDEALARMDRLDEEWWLDRSPGGTGVLVLDFEFI